MNTQFIPQTLAMTFHYNNKNMITNKIKLAAIHLVAFASFSILANARVTDGTLDPYDINIVYDSALRYGFNADRETLYVSNPKGWPEAGWVGDFEIPEAVIVDGVRMPVTSIGAHAFHYANANDTESHNISGSITIPSSVISIGYEAFSQNIMTEFIHNNSLTYIGENAFQDCVNLTSFRIPTQVKVIQSGTFSGCTSLAVIEFHNQVSTIGAYAFSGCTALLNPVFPTELTAIGEGAFGGCNALTSLTFPGKLNTIHSGFRNSDGAFYNCNSLLSVVLPASIATIGDGAFGSCVKLQKVTFLGALPGWDGPAVIYNINNGDSSQLITIICKPNRDFEEAFSDKTEYKILYSTPFAVIQNKDGKTIRSGSRVNYGIVNVNSTGSIITLRLKNIGSKRLKLGRARLLGSQKESFAILSTIPSSVAPGKSIALKVRFKPKTAETLSSTLEINCNDPVKKTLKLRFVGKGA